MRTEPLELLYSEQEVLERIRHIADQINALYLGRPVVMVCVLKGAFMFFADLLKYLAVAPTVDFVRVASYGMETASSKVISFTKDIEISIKDKHVIIVEDIVDTGHTVSFLLQQLSARGARSLQIAALVDKQGRRETDANVDFPGFVVDDGFIVGYGLDYAEQYRDLPAIYVYKPDN